MRTDQALGVPEGRAEARRGQRLAGAEARRGRRRLAPRRLGPPLFHGAPRDTGAFAVWVAGLV